VAAFHASIAIASENDSFGTPAAIQQPALENFSQIASELFHPQDRADLDFLRNWTVDNCYSLQEVFTYRKRSGYVRECHGDLHSGNIALVDGKITIFDCLEFNENLRWIDVMNEVGFLAMDLQEKGHPALAHRFLNDYLDIAGDYDGLRVLRFYMAYRAVVRAKIAILRAHQSHLNTKQRTELLNDYRAYLTLAASHARKPRPAIIITHGLSGSGKTTITQSLLEATGAIRIRSDIERKRLQGSPCDIPANSTVGEGLYSTNAVDITYRRLLELARTIVSAGYTVIVDATFIKRRHRDVFHELANAMAIPFVILDITADIALMRSRIEERFARKTDASEADISVLEHQLMTQEPLTPDEMPWVTSLDSATCNADETVRPLCELLDINQGAFLKAPYS